MDEAAVSVKPREVMPEGARTLPARYYADPALFQSELDGLFGAMWFYAGRSEEAARPGQYFVRELNGHNVVVSRNAAGGIRAFHNVCRHRGTRICDQATGQFAGSIQCPYHAWTYDLDGRLIGAPHMDEVPHFRKGDYPLLRVHAEEWDGHVFLNLSDAPDPLGAQLGPLVDKFRNWRMQDLRLGRRIVYDVKANWKLIIQNYNECLHCPNLHPALNKLSHYLSGENEPLRSTYMGGRMDLRAGRRHAVDGRHVPAVDPAGPAGRGRPARLLLLHLPEHDAQPASRLHADAHALADRARPDDQRLRVALPAVGDGPPGVRSRRLRRVLGHDEQAGLVRVRALTGRDRLAGIRTRGRTSNREDLLYAFDRFIVGFHEITDNGPRQGFPLVILVILVSLGGLGAAAVGSSAVMPAASRSSSPD